MSFIKNIRSPIRKIPFDQRREIISEINDSSSPGFDFFLMVFLSVFIATFGLILNSPAVIIGAMLVAPLMSPIIGIGLASIIGRRPLLKDALSALFRGALLAIVLSALIGLVNLYLPFVYFQELPTEIISRTHPSPIDLVVALAGGLAAAYSLTEPKLSAALPGVAIATALMPPLCVIGIGLSMQRWDVAGGAFLLFITNTVTIAFASALIFFLRGFNPYPQDGSRKLPPSLQLSAVLILLLLVPLTYYGIQFVQQATEFRTINDVVDAEVQKLKNTELVELNVTHDGEAINLNLTVRTNNPMSYQEVVNLQSAIVAKLSRPVSLRVNQINSELLDPLIPPTATSTATSTSTSTPGPSPTPTFTATLTVTPSATFTLTPLPTLTATFTSTPAQARALLYTIPLMRIYQYPGGPVIGLLAQNQLLTIMPQEVIYGNLVWVQVVDGDGREGWVPKVFIHILTPTPSPSATVTPLVTATPIISGSVTSTSTATP